MKYTVKTIIVIASVIAIVNACGKGGSDSGPGPTDPCAGITINVTGTVTHATPGSSDAIIAASATGGTKTFTYSIDNGAFQASGTFNNLTKGTHTVTAKNTDGCTGLAYFTVNETNVCTGTPGTKFTAVRNLLQTKCTPTCHSGTLPTGNLDLTVNCNIVLRKADINNRAVVIGDMPQGGSLTVAEKAIITDWVTAGGKITD